MKNVTKTVDLSEYSDEQIKIMFQSMELFEMVKAIVDALKNGSLGNGTKYDASNFNPVTPGKQILEALKSTCERNKIDPKLLNL